jgi:pimeloyl-ACP methyl ester carboxylesterase
VADLNYERRGIQDGLPGRTLVLIHGIGSRWQMWEPVLERVSAERDVVALDLPGFGFSPALVHGETPDAAGLAEAVHAFLSGLGLDRPHVAGNSLGGWVSLELARRGAVRSVTALSPAGFASRTESLWSTNALRATRALARLIRPDAARLAGRSWFRRLAYWQMTTGAAHLTSHDVAESISSLADAEGFEATLRALHQQSFRLGEPLPMPVTIAWGERDRLLLPRQAARAAAEIPNATIRMLPGCGHIPTYDDPELVAQVLLEGSSAS